MRRRRGAPAGCPRGVPHWFVCVKRKQHSIEDTCVIIDLQTLAKLLPSVSRPAPIESRRRWPVPPTSPRLSYLWLMRARRMAMTAATNTPNMIASGIRCIGSALPSGDGRVAIGIPPRSHQSAKSLEA